ncbi:hypothetical protein ACHAWF_013352 [Thalassiosira exigua]
MPSAPAPAPPTRRIKRALVVCDLQADLLPSLFAGDAADDGSGEIAAVDPPARRAAYLDAIRLVLLASTSSSLPEDDALVIFAGARFPPRYEGLHPEHCLYGALRRLNEKVNRLRPRVRRRRSSFASRRSHGSQAAPRATLASSPQMGAGEWRLA